MTQLPKEDLPDIHEVKPASPLAVGYVPQTSEINLRDVFGDLWRGKWIIAATTLVAVLAMAGIVHLMVPTYTARIIVSAAETSRTDRLLSQIGSVSELLTGLPGSISLQSEGSLILKMQAVIPTVEFAKRLDRKHRMLHTVFAAAWDERTQSWKPPPEPGWTERIWRRFLSFVHLPGWRPPDHRTLAAYLHRITFNKSPTTGVSEISFSHRNPEFALNLLSVVFYEADDYLREEERKRIASEIDYLRRKLDRTRMVEYREALLSLISVEEKKMMLMEAGDNYVGTLLEPPVVSAAPTFPPSKLMLWASVALGLMFGAFVTLLLRALRQK